MVTANLTTSRGVKPDLYNQLGDLRNDLMHAGKRKQPQGAQKVEERAKRLYASLKNTCRLSA